MTAVLAAKEKTLSARAFPQAETRVWGLPLENANGTEARWPATSTLAWGWRQFYGGTVSGKLDQRYYTAIAGRFYTPDPSTGVNLRNPITWNRYAYATDDPVNRYDPSGLDSCDPNATCVTVSGSYDSVGFADAGLNTALTAGSNSAPTATTAWNAAAAQAAAQAARLAALLAAGSAPQDAVSLRTQVAGNLALLALQNNPNCAALFGGSDPLVRSEAGYPDPSAVLGGILAGTGSVTIQYAFMAPFNINLAAGTYSINNATTAAVPPYNGTFAITINTASAAPFNLYNNPVNNAVTLLHELGHVYDFLYGAASTPIANDNGSAAISEANTALVKSTCFP